MSKIELWLFLFRETSIHTECSFSLSLIQPDFKIICKSIYPIREFAALLFFRANDPCFSVSLKRGKVSCMASKLRNIWLCNYVTNHAITDLAVVEVYQTLLNFCLVGRFLSEAQWA